MWKTLAAGAVISEVSPSAAWTPEQRADQRVVAAELRALAHVQPDGANVSVPNDDR